MGNSKRILSLDVLRVLACVMVVLMHSPMPTQQSGGLIGLMSSSVSYFTAPCIGLFFMVSGALLLPIKEQTAGRFMRKRLGKVLAPTLSWTAIYLIIKLLIGTDISAFTWLSIPFSAQGNGVLWFMYTLAGLYLLAPVISPWLAKASEKELRMYLLLWGVTLCYPLLKLALDINESNTGILYYFTGYAGYFILGYYMMHYGQKIKVPWATAGFAISLSAVTIVKLAGWEVNFYSLFWYLSIFVALMCIFWWKIITAICSRISFYVHHMSSKWITTISNLSFGIYLSHIAIMRYWLWETQWITNIGSYFIQTLVIAIFTFIFSAMFCYAISLLPFASYLIGYSSKKNIAKR